MFFWRETKGKIPTPNNPKPSVNTCKLKVWAVYNEGFLPERLVGWLLTHAFPNNLSPGVVPDRRVVPGFCRCLHNNFEVSNSSIDFGFDKTESQRMSKGQLQ